MQHDFRADELDSWVCRQWGHSYCCVNNQASIAWFTSTRGVYQEGLCFQTLFRTEESPLNIKFKKHLHRAVQFYNIFFKLANMIFSGWIGQLSLSLVGALILLSKRPSLNCLIHFYKRCVSRRLLRFQTLFRTEESPLDIKFKKHLHIALQFYNIFFKLANMILEQINWTVEFVTSGRTHTVV